MKPTKFDQQTDELQRPPSMTDEECAPLPVFRDGQVCISCWRGTWWDRLRFLFTGRVWLWVHMGRTQPPVYVGTDCPFYLAGPIPPLVDERKEAPDG